MGEMPRYKTGNDQITHLITKCVFRVNIVVVVAFHDITF